VQRLPDESVLGGYRSAIFLFRQPFLLIPGAVATVGAAIWLLGLMIANGRTSAANVVTLLLIAPMTGFGFAVLTALPTFFVVRAFATKPPPLVLRDGEALIEEVVANHFLNHEGRGGKLFITDRRVVFTPHRFNVQLAPVEQRLADVRDVRWARVVGAAGAPMSSFLELVEGARSERYVVSGAAELGARIEAAASAASTMSPAE
jgi:hypothetical protein